MFDAHGLHVSKIVLVSCWISLGGCCPPDPPPQSVLGAAAHQTSGFCLMYRSKNARRELPAIPCFTCLRKCICSSWQFHLCPWLFACAFHVSFRKKWFQASLACSCVLDVYHYRPKPLLVFSNKKSDVVIAVVKHCLMLMVCMFRRLS